MERGECRKGNERKYRNSRREKRRKELEMNMEVRQMNGRSGYVHREMVWSEGEGESRGNVRIQRREMGKAIREGEQTRGVRRLEKQRR